MFGAAPLGAAPLGAPDSRYVQSVALDAITAGPVGLSPLTVRQSYFVEFAPFPTSLPLVLGSDLDQTHDFGTSPKIEASLDIPPAPLFQRHKLSLASVGAGPVVLPSLDPRQVHTLRLAPVEAGPALLSTPLIRVTHNIALAEIGAGPVEVKGAALRQTHAIVPARIDASGLPSNGLVLRQTHDLAFEAVAAPGPVVQPLPFLVAFQFDLDPITATASVPEAMWLRQAHRLQPSRLDAGPIDIGPLSWRIIYIFGGGQSVAGVPQIPGLGVRQTHGLAAQPVLAGPVSIGALGILGTQVFDLERIDAGPVSVGVLNWSQRHAVAPQAILAGPVEADMMSLVQLVDGLEEIASLAVVTADRRQRVYAGEARNARHDLFRVAGDTAPLMFQLQKLTADGVKPGYDFDAAWLVVSHDGERREISGVALGDGRFVFDAAKYPEGTHRLPYDLIVREGGFELTYSQGLIVSV